MLSTARARAEPAAPPVDADGQAVEAAEPGETTAPAESGAAAGSPTDAPAGSEPVAPEPPAPEPAALGPADEKPPPPSSTPPPVRAADPNWNAPVEDRGVEEPARSPPESTIDGALGAQVFNTAGKAMSGLSLRFGKGLLWGQIEFTPVWLTSESDEFDGRFLGNQWGFYFEVAPLRTRRFELLGGLGLDVYHLWGIHGDEAQVTLGFKLDAYVGLTERVWAFGTVRGYPWHSEGLELGVYRDGRETVPLLASVGVEWRFQ